MGPESWEISTESTFEQIVKRIMELPQPVAIILFGADGDFKTEIFAKFVKAIPRLDYGYEIRSSDPTINDTLVKTKTTFDNDRNVIVLIDGESSCNHRERHQAITTLRKYRAKSVVGIYVRTKPKPIRPLLSSIETLHSNNHSNLLRQKPPTAEGLDFLITVSEE